MNIGHSNTSTARRESNIPQHSFPMRCPTGLIKCVSNRADVVETSGSPSVAAATDDDAVIAAPEPTNEENTLDMGDLPAEIPPEETKGGDSDREIEDDEESDYEYEDDDDVAFGGFLAPTLTTTSSASAAACASEPARIVEEDNVVAAAPGADLEAQKKWREPSREAVNMSLRAQSETSGGKRRLAQDLYRIMNQDTEEAGFSLAPKSEDAMDKWTIKLFQFDEDSNLAKDMLVMGIDHIELEMQFPDQYPFEPPFVRVVRPRFKRQTGFVMNGALCMELLTKDGWNPINDIESVIVSIRSLLVVGDGRLQAAADLSETRYEALLKAASGKQEEDEAASRKRRKLDEDKHSAQLRPVTKQEAGSYSASEAQAAYSHLSDYHKKKGWDSSGWWARKG